MCWLLFYKRKGKYILSIAMLSFFSSLVSLLKVMQLFMLKNILVWVGSKYMASSFVLRHWKYDWSSVMGGFIMIVPKHFTKALLTWGGGRCHKLSFPVLSFWISSAWAKIVLGLAQRWAQLMARLDGNVPIGISYYGLLRILVSAAASFLFCERSEIWCSLGFSFETDMRMSENMPECRRSKSCL